MESTSMNDRDILKLEVPKENQPLDYYRKYLRHLDPMLNILEIRLGYLRWLQGTALLHAIESRRVKRGEYGKLLKQLGISKATAFNCRKIALGIPRVNAEKLGYSEMLRIVGILKDVVDDEEAAVGSASSLIDEDIAPEGENPLPRVTFHNFVEKLQHARDVLTAMTELEYAPASREDALRRYTDAKEQIRLIKKLCSDLDQRLADRIRANKKPRRSKTRAA